MSDPDQESPRNSRSGNQSGYEKVSKAAPQLDRPDVPFIGKLAGRPVPRERSCLK